MYPQHQPSYFQEVDLELRKEFWADMQNWGLVSLKMIIKASVVDERVWRPVESERRGRTLTFTCYPEKKLAKETELSNLSIRESIGGWGSGGRGDVEPRTWNRGSCFSVPGRW